MENILLALNTNAPEESAFEFACYLSEVTKAKITSVLLESLETEDGHIHETACASCMEKMNSGSVLKSNTANNIFSDIRNKCTDKGFRFSHYHEDVVSVKEMIKDSRFADVIVIDGAKLFIQGCKNIALTFVKNVLKQSECPLIIAPSVIENIEEVVFLYDGTASSAFAIKQFTYLIPQFHNKRVNTVMVNIAQDQSEESRYRFKEWLKEFYIDLHFEEVEEERMEKIYIDMFKKANQFLVSGIDNNKLLQFLKHKSDSERGVTLQHPLFLAYTNSK